MTKLIIDAVGIKSRGGAVVLLDVLHAAERLDDIEQIYVLASPAPLRGFLLKHTERRTVIDIAWAESPSGRFWWALHGLRRWAESVPDAVVLGLNGFGAGRRVPSAVFLQQPVPYYAEAMAMYPWGYRLRMMLIRALQKRSALSARMVIVQSSEFKKQVNRSLKLPDKNIVVCLPSPPSLPAAQPQDFLRFSERARASDAIVLYVGSDAPHKNLGMLREALNLLPAKCNVRCWMSLPASNPVCDCPRVDALGAIGREELAAVYAAATVVVMPSVTETVGLPLLESMAAGVPVVVADRPYARAICSDAALLFDPHSPADCAEKIQRLTTDVNLRNRHIEAGRSLLKQRSAEGEPYLAMMRHTVALARTSV